MIYKAGAEQEGAILNGDSVYLLQSYLHHFVQTTTSSSYASSTCPYDEEGTDQICTDGEEMQIWSTRDGSSLEEGDPIIHGDKVFFYVPSVDKWYYCNWTSSGKECMALSTCPGNSVSRPNCYGEAFLIYKSEDYLR